MSDILTSPPTHSPSPRRYRQQPRAIATREKILFVSAEMFNANGYAGAGINEMLDSSGLSKGALYFHFESKEAIAQSLIDQWRTFVDDLRCEVSSTETSALAQIVMLFREHAEAVSEDLRLRAGLKLSVERGITGSGGAYREWVDMVESLVATAIDRGELHDNDAAQRFFRSKLYDVPWGDHRSPVDEHVTEHHCCDRRHAHRLARRGAVCRRSSACTDRHQLRGSSLQIMLLASDSV